VRHGLTIQMHRTVGFSLEKSVRSATADLSRYAEKAK
jgi:hypothetical protein